MSIVKIFRVEKLKTNTCCGGKRVFLVKHSTKLSGSVAKYTFIGK